METIERQLVLPIFNETTPLATPKLLPKRVTVVKPLVGPFLGAMLDMVGASYPMLIEAL